MQEAKKAGFAKIGPLGRTKIFNNHMSYNPQAHNFIEYLFFVRYNFDLRKRR
jgi:hypothetical protein